MGREHFEEFKETLVSSMDAVWVAARWLHENYKADVRVNHQAIADSYEDRMDSTDDGDIHLHSSAGIHRVEIKRLSIDFTSSSDWPYRDFIVCAKHSYDLAKEKPRFYMIMNKAMTHAGFVSCRYTAKHWSSQSRADSRRGGEKQDFYLCPLSLVEWRTL